MRIGIMADIYKPHISGVTNHIALTKKYLEKWGHEVYIFTFGGVAEDEEPNVIRSPGMPLVDSGFYLSFRYNNRAINLLHTMDVVHVHHPFLSGYLALRYCKFRKIPIVYTNHTRYDLYAQAYLPMLPEGIGESFLTAYFPNYCRSCDLVIAPSKGMKDVLLHFGVNSPIEIIPNGVELTPFLQNVNPILRSEFGFSEQNIVLLYIGRLGPEKNLPFLIRSFAGTLKGYENIRLLIAGDGVERENLEALVKKMKIENQVKFAGSVTYDKIPRYLGMADAFVTASVTEVHPLSVVEAQAAGLPVLGIQSPGVGDTVIDGTTGLLAGEDIAEFTALMCKLVSDHSLRMAMGNHARESVSIYDIERTTKIILGFYEYLVLKNNQRKLELFSRIRNVKDHFRISSIAKQIKNHRENIRKRTGMQEGE